MDGSEENPIIIDSDTTVNDHRPLIWQNTFRRVTQPNSLLGWQPNWLRQRHALHHTIGNVREGLDSRTTTDTLLLSQPRKNISCDKQMYGMFGSSGN